MKITPQMKEEIVEGATQHWGVYGSYAITGTEKYQNGSWEWEEVDKEYCVFFEDLENIYGVFTCYEIWKQDEEFNKKVVFEMGGEPIKRV